MLAIGSMEGRSFQTVQREMPVRFFAVWICVV